MPGYNHYDDCMCGWCWKGGSSDSENWPRRDYGPRWPSTRATIESYTIPNAHCPVCGEPVFFYRSPYDGRVFFDALGPPWPKHPCTDNSRRPVEQFSVPYNYKPKRFDWNLQGWEPVVIEDVEKVKGWARLKLRPISTLQPGFIVRASPWRRELAPGIPAHMKPLNAFGEGRLSLLHQTPQGEIIVDTPLFHRTFVACETETIEKAKLNDLPSLCEVADATFRAWQTKGDTPGTVQYPAFVDFRIAKRWVEKAAALGSDAAKRILETHPLFANIS